MSVPLVDAYLDELLADATEIVPTTELRSADASIAAAPAGPSLGRVAAAPPPVPALAAHQTTIQPTPMSPTETSSLPGAIRRHPADTTAIGTPARTVANSSRWLRVGIGADHYAFELLRVQEVVRVAPIVAMRGAAPAVLGVMNLRGRIVPVFDLGRWLGSADVIVSEHSRTVVVERNDELIGVLVTMVEDVATLRCEHIEPPLAGSAAGAIVGIARVGRTPTVLLDANALFD